MVNVLLEVAKVHRVCIITALNHMLAPHVLGPAKLFFFSVQLAFHGYCKQWRKGCACIHWSCIVEFFIEKNVRRTQPTRPCWTHRMRYRCVVFRVCIGQVTVMALMALWFRQLRGEEAQEHHEPEASCTFYAMKCLTKILLVARKIAVLVLFTFFKTLFF